MRKIHTTNKDQRLSRAQKEANDFNWYKEKVKQLDTGNNYTIGNSGSSDYKRMKINYDLVNNIIDEEDFKYVCKPFGDEAGSLPANMVNRDVISNKVKAVVGLEMKRPFDYKVMAINPEATTRKEQAEFDKIKEFVINTIMTPIRQELEANAGDMSQATPEERQALQAQIEEQMKARTPDEVRSYMERDHQDPAEVMNHQLLEYLIVKRDANRKFNNGTKHAAISAKEIYWVGEVNGEPDFRVCNPLRANYDRTEDLEFFEKGEWFTYEYRMTPSEVVAFFADELTNKEIDQIYENHSNYESRAMDSLFDFSKESRDLEEDDNTVRVLHCTWKSLREVNFLTYRDENDEVQTKVVDETYRMDENAGDMSMTSEWIPETYETYRIQKDIYKRMRPIPGQFKDMDNLYDNNLPYYGAVYDATNSTPTSLVDRGKNSQYFLNIIYYRLELLMASDKGKKVLMNINGIPDSVGIDIKSWQYFFESSPFGWMNPNEEGVDGYNDMNMMAKVIDLSTASDMNNYIQLAETIKIDCGEAMGVSKQMEAQISSNEAVGNTQQALSQNTLILESFYSLHNIIKRNVLNALLETAKVCYADGTHKKLSYILDDLSLRTLTVDPELLNNSTIGLFVSDSSKANEIKQLITDLAHAALQNQQIRLSDVLSVIKEESITVAEGNLKKSEKEEKEYQASLQQEKIQAEKEAAQALNEMKKEEWQHDKDMIVLKEEERRKTELAKAALLGASFNPDIDKDNNGVNDFVQLSQFHLDAGDKIAKQKLEQKKFEQKSKYDEEKLKNEKEKLSIDRQKIKSQGSPSK